MAFWQNTPSTASPLNATNLNNLSGGWTSIPATLTYSSADAPTFVMSTSTDTTGYLSVGMKIKLTQTTVKYFIITAITSTTITIYGGTEYTLTSAAITAPFYSVHKSPYGFPTSPDKWTTSATLTTLTTQANPVGLTWYNLGGMFIFIPIGNWEVSYSVLGQTGLAGDASSNKTFRTTLSTTNDGATHPQFTVSYGVVGNYCRAQCMKTNNLTLTAKTLFYLNTLADVTSSGIYNLNGDSTLVIKAVCAYL